MIRVIRLCNTKVVEKILSEKHFGEGHYCNNIELLKEVKDGPYKIRNIIKRNGLMSFFVGYDDEEPMIILPIFMRGNMATIAGTNEYFDYVDLFYRVDMPLTKIKQTFESVMSDLKNRGVATVKWSFVPEKSFSRTLLDGMCIGYYEEIENTEIVFSSYSSFVSTLSKSTKQNLRTAENRLNRDGKTYEILSNMSKPLSSEIILQCIDLYCARQKQKYCKGLLNQIMIKTFNYSTQMMRRQEGLLVALKIEDNIAAFMFGYINSDRHSYEVPRLAISEAFNFYSPGMILINRSIEMLSQMSDIRILDLCRGSEQYKIKMGGKIYPTYNYIIEL